MDTLDRTKVVDQDLLPLTMVVADYDRTHPLLDGRVQPDGIKLKAVSGKIGYFCIRPVYEEYDIAEMSLSWYLMAHCREEPVVALPVFPLRMPVHAYLFCRSDASFNDPGDLAGKRVGAPRYRYTVNLWLRGIIEEHYGVSPGDMSWITTDEEGAGYEIPAGISVERRSGCDLEELLIDGEIDCLFSPIVPPAFRRGDPRIRRLFPDCSREIARYFDSTGIFPITHTVVMGEALWRREPWIAERMLAAYRDAQQLVEAHYYNDPKHLTLPRAVLLLEEERATFGPDPWSHGLATNRNVLDTFIRYAHEQGYIPRRPALEELFAENTLTL